MSPSDLPKPFMPGDEFPPDSTGEFGTGDLDYDMWLRPNRGLADAHDILMYGMSVDGYEYARVVLGKDLFEMLDDLRVRCSGVALKTARFVDLRLWLFFTQRAWSHSGGSVEDDDESLHALNVAICDAWDREWPTRPDR